MLRWSSIIASRTDKETALYNDNEERANNIAVQSSDTYWIGRDFIFTTTWDDITELDNIIKIFMLTQSFRCLDLHCRCTDCGAIKD